MSGLSASDYASFSILYRIEWVETGVGVRHTQNTQTFQYPVSDRMG